MTVCSELGHAFSLHGYDSDKEEKALNSNERDLLKGAVALSGASIAGLTGMAWRRKNGQPLTEGAPFRPSWNSLLNLFTPQSLRDSKVGICKHWGTYSVPDYGANEAWFEGERCQTTEK